MTFRVEVVKRVICGTESQVDLQDWGDEPVYLETETALDAVRETSPAFDVPDGLMQGDGDYTATGDNYAEIVLCYGPEGGDCTYEVYVGASVCMP